MGNINIGFNSDSFDERVLSNLFDTPFIFEGRFFRSSESFIQSLRYPEGSEQRTHIEGISGISAKVISKKTVLNNGDITIFKGLKYTIGGQEYHDLIKKSLREKLLQNPDVLEVLINTGDRKITHILLRKDGITPIPDSINLPGDMFCRFLEELRGELGAGFKKGMVSFSSQAFLVSRSFLYKIKAIQSKLFDALEGADMDISDIDTGIVPLLESRSVEIAKILKSRGIDIGNFFGMYGEIVFHKYEIKDLGNKLRKFLLDNSRNRIKGSKVSSRGREYYFNMEGLSVSRKKRKDKQDTLHAISNIEMYSINSDEYFGNVLKYWNEIRDLLGDFSGRRLSDLSDLEKKSFLFLLDHYRNILLFIKGQSLIFQDPENFSRTMRRNNFNNKGDFDNQIIRCGFLDTPLLSRENSEELDKSIFDTLSIYFDVVFGENQDREIQSFDFDVEEFNENILSLYNKVMGKFGNGKKFISRFLLNTLRVSREADNPLRTLYSSLNFITSNEQELERLEDIQILGLMYGGIEIPYILKLLFSRIDQYIGKDIFIDFMVQPSYNTRGGEPHTLNEADLKSENIIIVDDNICNGKTVSHAKGLLHPFTQKSFTLAVDVGHKINDVSVSVLDTVAGFLPIKTGYKGYANNLSMHLRKRGIIGKT